MHSCEARDNAVATYSSSHGKIEALGRSYSALARARTRARAVPGVVGLAEAVPVHPGVVEVVQQEAAPLEVEEVQPVSLVLRPAAADEARVLLGELFIRGRDTTRWGSLLFGREGRPGNRLTGWIERGMRCEPKGQRENVSSWLRVFHTPTYAERYSYPPGLFFSARKGGHGMKS